MKIILASNSPRRRELMKKLQIPFEAHSPKYEENSKADVCPAEEALLFARGKAKSLAKDFSDSLIIGCDTIVELNGVKLGKPQDAHQALQMLRILSGKIHRVLTGVSVLNTATHHYKECLGQTLVKMREFSEEEAKAYIATGEPMDKAGAYAIQGKGGELVEQIEGDFFNVVGLPLRDLVETLKEFLEIKVNDLDDVYASVQGFNISP